MFTESLSTAPALIGLILYLFLGTIGLVWHMTRPSSQRILSKTDSQ